MEFYPEVPVLEIFYYYFFLIYIFWQLFLKEIQYQYPYLLRFTEQIFDALILFNYKIMTMVFIFSIK